ncbi:MAG TPA: CoA pyrophosphatase [Mycobacteriales bacterium]|jgi:8-oxo-dGTP pyrophosphatase MutT (NUDIX family)|nr:CoA pyrophosphatase [Mycobacteriales bacterium]
MSALADGVLLQCAVLALVDRWPTPSFVLTQRADGVGIDPGAICWPGGRSRPEETPRETALREAAEEISLPPESVSILCEGPTVVVPDRAWAIVPVLALLLEPAAFAPAASEVATIHLVPLDDLIDPRTHRHVTTPGGRELAWELPAGRLWGPTATITGWALDMVASGWTRRGCPDGIPPLAPDQAIGCPP